MNETRTIIDVWAPWCRPCRAMEPIVDGAAARHADRVVLEKVNADENSARVRELRVRAVPTLIAMSGDRELGRLTGAQSEEAINDLFALATGHRRAEAERMSKTDRAVRLTAAAAVLMVGLLSGPAIHLLVVGAVIGASTLTRPGRTWDSG